MLPEKHPTVPNAHSKFEEVITAFVQVKSQRKMISYLFQQLIGHLKSSGDNITSLMPGEIFVSNFQCSIQLQSNAGNAWKKAIRSVPTNIPIKDRGIGATYNILFRQTYPDVIVGSQKQSQNLNMKVIYIKEKRNEFSDCSILKGLKRKRGEACCLLETHQ